MSLPSTQLCFLLSICDFMTFDVFSHQAFFPIKPFLELLIASYSLNDLCFDKPLLFVGTLLSHDYQLFKKYLIFYFKCYLPIPEKLSS